MAVSVQADLMALVRNHSTLFGKSERLLLSSACYRYEFICGILRLQTMARYEKRRLNVVFIKES